MSKLNILPRRVGVGTFVATPRIKELVNQVLDSGVISYGEKSKQFEKQFGMMHDCKYAILSNSGTSALHVALQAMRERHLWGSGDKVIVPATTFVASANVIVHNRMIPTFVDVSPETFNIDDTLIEQAITDSTKAIMPVHMFGQPCDMAPILDIANKYNLRIIEDSCETMFATHNNRKVGSFGEIGCFSTYVAHIIVTGVGGISTTNDPEYAWRMRSLVNHGLQIEYLNPDENFSPNPMPGRRFRFDTIGHSFRITELEAAIGIAQLETAHRNMSIRARNARHLEAGIRILNEEYGNVIQTQKNVPRNRGSHAHMMFPLVLNDPADKEPMMEYLNSMMIETRDLPPILCHPVYKWVDANAFPVSKRLLECGFYVGCHQYLTEEDVQYVIQCLGRYYERKLAGK